MDTYLSLTIDLPEAEAEDLQSALWDAGATGLELRDREGPHMPGVRVPAPGEVIVVAFFGDRETAEQAQAEVTASNPKARLQLEEVANQDWSNSWKALIKSVHVGRLWVGPPWEAESAPKEAVKLVIEPKMAFGTGDHPTTSLCLAAVDEFMASHPGASVLDVGTGTGVLAIAAKKLGAGRVVGTDNDPISVELAQENAELNQTPDVEFSGSTVSDVSGTFELVVANILANTLIALAPEISSKVEKRLLLAGVLAHQRDEVAAAYVKQGLIDAGGATVGEWVRLDFSK